MTETSYSADGRSSLGERLAGLDIATPAHLLDAEAMRGRPARRLAQRRRRFRRAAAAMGVAVFLGLGNGAAAYFAPNYAHVLADVPILDIVTGPALRAAGLSAGDVGPVYEVGTWSGVTVTLVGTYADPLQTVLFVDIEGLPSGGPGRLAPRFGLGQITLTDQFGQSYSLVGGEGLGVGPYPVIFQPLRGVAAAFGGRLTLHVQFWTAKKAGVSGEIDLHVTVVSGSDHELTVPPAQTANGTTYSIAGLYASANSLEVHTRISGSLINADLATLQQINTQIQEGKLPTNGAGVCFPGVFLITPSGAFEIPTAVPNSQSPTAAYPVLDEMRLFAISEAGTYRVVVSGPGCSSAPAQAEQVLATWSISVSG